MYLRYNNKKRYYKKQEICIFVMLFCDVVLLKK